MFDFEAVFSGLKLLECEDPLDKYDINDILWYVKLPGQENFVPPDQREGLPKVSLEDFLKLPEYDTEAVDGDLNRRWETLKAELLEGERTERGDGKIVDEAAEQDSAITG